MVEPSSLTQYTQEQRDCLQEICNIATGQTADVLARKLNAFVTLPIPHIQIIDADCLAKSLKHVDPQSSVYAASQYFKGEGEYRHINGLALVLLSECSLRELSASSCDEASVAREICSPMIQTCLTALSEQWQIPFSYDVSQCLGIESFESICRANTLHWRKVLLVEMHYRLENRQFDGELLLLFPDQAIITMAQKLDELLDF